MAGFGGPENDDLYHLAPLSRSLPSAPEGFYGPWSPPLSFFINDLPNLLHALPALLLSFVRGGIIWGGGGGGPGGRDVELAWHTARPVSSLSSAICDIVGDVCSPKAEVSRLSE